MEGNISLNERTQTINNKINLHILGVPMNKLSNWLITCVLWLLLLRLPPLQLTKVMLYQCPAWVDVSGEQHLTAVRPSSESIRLMQSLRLCCESLEIEGRTSSVTTATLPTCCRRPRLWCIYLYFFTNMKLFCRMYNRHFTILN